MAGMSAALPGHPCKSFSVVEFRKCARKPSYWNVPFPPDELVELTDHESGRKFVMTNRQYQRLAERLSELMGSVRVVSDEKSLSGRPPTRTRLTHGS
jgi:hypothetical protein